MTEYKDLKMKCTKADPQEPFFTEGKEYDIIKNACGYGIMDNDGEVPEYGTTLFELEQYLNEFWDSKFKLVNIDERTKIRSVFQRTLVQYNKDIAYLQNSIRRNKSNISETQLAVIKVQREAIQELYDEIFKGGNE
ncbi:hypothetical protein CH14_gp05 [Enterococcus phage IME-EF4]|uniref:Uncharacterized protein n=1 Tax=Enterococcus phage IME-EF4 TaxID=1432658 RepID=V5UQL7_9CAUD|nr:hypothetical protein CH14_gp05 [Enterococcus phage IME-EF4]AHB79806.1 hypothetical protein IME-EF4_5 [Enterococcus phage IME-EF4]